MTDTLTFGLVQVTNRSGQEKTQVLKEVTGTYVDGYRCTECNRLQTEDDASTGSIWACDDCSSKTEMEADETARYCDSCRENREFTRLDGENGTAEGIVCQQCYAALQEVEELFICGEDCGAILATEAETHLYGELENAWD